MKLIHTADLHLDSSLAKFPSDEAKERRAELLDTFRRMVETADEQGVCGILIAGDLFDSEKQLRKRTQKAIRELIAQYAGIQFYYLCGNHDAGAELFGEEPAPENFHTFAKKWTTYHLGDVTVTGAKNPMPETLSPDPNKINLLLLHGKATDTYSSADPEEIPLRAYAKKGLDYLALGHYHSFTEYRIDDRCVACYSGTPEGRGFDECGEKGYVLLEIAPGAGVKYRFVPFAKRKLHDVRLDLSGCTAQAELEKRAEEALFGIPFDDYVKLTVTGEIDPEFEPDYFRIDRALAERFRFGRRKDETTALIRPEDYRNDHSLKGEFIRQVWEDKTLSQEDRDAILRLGLQALYGKEIDL